MSDRPSWLNEIRNPGMYPHAVTQIQFIETHISWVILTGDWAYKLKKPVNFGFVDFSTLELRRLACLEEIRLNRRTAPRLYDGVVLLAAEPDGPRFDGEGPAIEYAVRMREFAQEDLLEHCLERHELSMSFIEELARAVAALHHQAAVATPESEYGDPVLIRDNVLNCLSPLQFPPDRSLLASQRNACQLWVHSEWNRLFETFAARRKQGWVRECHGDLHLGNLVRIEGRPVLFDCLEFNPTLRWIDVISDLAFLLMDLFHLGQDSMAWRVLNEWLEQTGDFEGLHVLKFYLIYRALVRAKVAALRAGQAEITAPEAERLQGLLANYLCLAQKMTRSFSPAIIVMHGLSGSGKTFLAKQLAASLPAIQIRSDVERKRMLGSEVAGRDSPDQDRNRLYTMEATRRTYLRLNELAETVLTAGYPVIMDAAFLRQVDRTEVMAMANRCSVPCLIVSCHAPESVLRQRVVQRQKQGLDASDADANVLTAQLDGAEPLTLAEREVTVEFDTTSDQCSELLQTLLTRLGMTLTPA